MLKQLNWQTILTILAVSLALYLIAKYTGNTYEGFGGYDDSTFCTPCEKQSNADPSYCLACDNCYYDNGKCKSIYANNYVGPFTGSYYPPVYGFNSSSWYRPWNWNWNTWVR